jgi:D-alanyl-D-alanine carboxypeptidase/D-alanyl-D-alanine carboxypeptidase (penicillin-binding protein 5/6)
VGENYIKDFRATEKEGLKPPLTTGDIAGTAKYILKDDTEIEINLYPDTDIYSKVSMLSSLVEKLREYRDITVLFFILVLIELLLVLYKLFRIIRNVLYRLINHFKQ